MAGAAEKRDAFFVRPSEEAKGNSEKIARVETMTLPDGRRVHALERKIFDRAVREAMKPKK